MLRRPQVRRYLELTVFIIILMTFIFWTRKRGLLPSRRKVQSSAEDAATAFAKISLNKLLIINLYFPILLVYIVCTLTFGE